MPPGDGPQPTTSILNLSIELLDQIFRYFGHPPVGRDGIHSKETYRAIAEDRRTIKRLRLVCRLFHNVASPILIPVLRISLDQPSLRRAQDIAHHPMLAAGIRAVQISLEYRPASLASSIREYAEFQKRTLLIFEDSQAVVDMRRGLHRHPVWMKLENGEEEIEDDSDDDDWPHEDRTKAVINFRAVTEACNHFIKSHNSTSGLWKLFINEELVAQYKELLLECFSEYSRCYEEQIQLVSSNSFVETIAKVVSSLRRPVTLELDDGKHVDQKPTERNPLGIFLDNIELSRFLVAPQKWSDAEKAGGPRTITPATIIPDLSVAIYKAGGLISQFELSCLPEPRNWDLDASEGLATQNSKRWNDLRMAFRGLKVIKLHGVAFTQEPVRRLPPASRSKVYLQKYLETLVSNKFLEEVLLDFSLLLGLTINEHGTIIWCPVGTVLQTSCPQALRITIRCMSLTQTELEDFFKRLSPRTEDLRLVGINLLEGSWIRPLDILRERIAPRCAEGTFSLFLKNLTGAELGPMEESTVAIEWSQESLEGGKVTDMLVALMRYVRGDGITENPLVAEEPYLDE